MGKGAPTRFGKAVVERKLGEGTTSVVYLARHEGLAMSVAVKVLRAELLERRPHYADRFLEEARTAARLDHPNIVRVFDCGVQDGHHYMVMDYVPGRDCMELLRGAPEGLEWRRATQIILQAARGLGYAAARGLIHRDIKPSNLIIDRSGRVRVTDLGLAKPTADIGATGQNGRTAGTPHYMSPEQIRAAPDLDLRSDIYSLGASYYHLLTGHPPFTGETAMEVVSKHLTEEPEPPHLLKEHLPVAVCQVVCRMMAKQPQERYQDYRQLRRSLRQLLGTAPFKRPEKRRHAPGTHWKPVQAACKCGYKMTVTAQLAGRTIRCSGCGCLLVLPPGSKSHVKVCRYCGMICERELEHCPDCGNPLAAREHADDEARSAALHRTAALSYGTRRAAHAHRDEGALTRRHLAAPRTVFGLMLECLHRPYELTAIGAGGIGGRRMLLQLAGLYVLWALLWPGLRAVVQLARGQQAAWGTAEALYGAAASGVELLAVAAAYHLIASFMRSGARYVDVLGGVAFVRVLVLTVFVPAAAMGALVRALTVGTSAQVVAGGALWAGGAIAAAVGFYCMVRYLMGLLGTDWFASFWLSFIANGAALLTALSSRRLLVEHFT
ncbi:MAG: serine/threonine-protein kinase [Candidatus Brocadiia bacterium]